MSRETVADRWGVETVYVGKKRIHIGECHAVKLSTDPKERPADTVPADFYDLCRYCDPDHEIDHAHGTRIGGLAGD